MKQVEVAVIGAGPHALSLVTRLTCHHSWDECTFDVHGNRWEFTPAPQENVCKPFDMDQVVVIDPHGRWMEEWKSNFNTLEIVHLRSTVLVHTDSYDSLSLLEHIEKENSQHSLPNVFDTLRGNSHTATRRKRAHRMVGTRHVFNESQRKFFTIPSSATFLRHAEWLVHRHGLQKVVKKDCVETVEFLGSDVTYPMRLRLASGEIIEAKNVVYAANQASARTPAWAAPLRNSGKVFHTSDTASLSRCLEGERKKLLFVGGGLSSLHASIAAARRGHQVTVVARSPLTVRQFDIPPVWMSPLRNSEFAKFYALSPEERLKLIRATRGGGSVTPEVHKSFLHEVKNQRITFLVHAEVDHVQPEGDALRATIRQSSQESFEGVFDEIILATGREFSLHSESKHPTILAALQKEHPIPTCSGFPLLGPNLRWSDKIPLYVMGAFASLEIGPDALNLMGGRVAASRIVPDLIEYECEDLHDDEEDTHHSLTSIHVCNRFSSLLSEQ